MNEQKLQACIQLLSEKDLNEVDSMLLLVEDIKTQLKMKKLENEEYYKVS